MEPWKLRLLFALPFILVFVVAAIWAIIRPRTRPPIKQAPWEQLEGRTHREGQPSKHVEMPSFDEQAEAQRNMFAGFDSHDPLYQPGVYEIETRAEAAERQEREQRLFGGTPGKTPDEDDAA